MNFHQLGLSLLAVFLCLVPPAQAEDGVKFLTIPGQPWQISFPDGRLAEVKYDPRPALVIQIPFQVTENTCTEKIGMRGSLQTSFSVGHLALHWIKHPTKPTAAVVFKGKTGNEELSVFSFLFVSAAEAKRLPLMAKKLVPQDLSGNDFSWLPGGGAKAPEQAYLTRWDIEAMILNEETGFTENRTIGLTQGVTFKAIESGKLRMTDVKRYLSGIFAFFQGDIWSMVSRGTNGDACLISLKADLIGAAGVLNSFFTSSVQFQPYPYGLDEFSTIAMPDALKKFSEKPQDYDAN